MGVGSPSVTPLTSTLVYPRVSPSRSSTATWYVDTASRSSGYASSAAVTLSGSAVHPGSSGPSLLNARACSVTDSKNDASQRRTLILYELG